ncbi:MAG: hypothetical protein KJ950_15590 [Proteobacteria bacterium]|nr:hypothetical protein [Pseudomonadota bacterium]MBU1686949.1 hypothetical protein [Pseudomonadota bacterium]
MSYAVDISGKVKEIMNRNNVQIRSLELLDPRIKALFTGRKLKAVVIVNNKVFERLIDSPEKGSIDVIDTELISYLKVGQLILIVLPVDKKKRYVLQTTVQSLYVDRFRVEPLDPRKNRRYPQFTDTLVRVRVVNDPTVMRIQVGEIDVTRKIDGLRLDDQIPLAVGSSPVNYEKKSNKSSGEELQPVAEPVTEENSVDQELAEVRDVLCINASSELSPDQQKINQQPQITGKVDDISLGGICFKCEGKGDVFVLNQLLYLDVALENSFGAGSRPMCLNLAVFALVRAVRPEGDFCRLNLQFLSGLPPSAESYFPEFS